MMEIVTYPARVGVVAGAMMLGLTTGADRGQAATDKATVITITQIACQFLEVENGIDHEFVSKKSEDCKTINRQTGPERLATAKVLELKPGRYVFRVTNQDVPYELGFWLREKDYDWLNPIHKLTKTSVSGGGLDLGETQEYEVELKPGEYLYSCPLNPTPDYRLVVAN